ncbi:hypothetical protein LZK73_21860 [Neorhizobium galegae]|nr:hypothetical protein LZK73_21860 [Neorhizobium galegae]
MKITVEAARLDHLPPILDDIRPEDYREWYAGTGNADIQSVLQPVFAEGRYARAAVGEDSKALVMWGVDELSESAGSVWMFATSTAERHAIAIHRHLKPQLQDILSRWAYLEAWADSRNTKHHLWLEWLGFQYEREEFLEPLGLPFKLYTLRRP